MAGIKVEPFYLNVRLLNKEEVVASKVTSKLGEGLFAKAASSLANKIVSEESITSKLSEILSANILKAVEPLGIGIELEQRFRQGSVLVYRVRVKSVDTLQLVLAAKGPEFASGFSRLLGTLTELGLAESAMPNIEDSIAKKVGDGMRAKFGELIPDRCLEQGLLVEVKVCSLADQGETFFDLLEASSA